MEVDTIQKPALAVEPPDANFDPNLTPETGEQYLQKVMYERGKCPVVVVAEKPQPRRQQKALSGLAAVPTDDVKNVAHRALIPTREWETMQNQKFSELRDTITAYRSSAQYEENLQRTHVYLNFDDRKHLHEYCANNLPYVSILLSIPQRNLEILLEYLHEWLQDSDQADTVHVGQGAVAARRWLPPGLDTAVDLRHTRLSDQTARAVHSQRAAGHCQNVHHAAQRAEAGGRGEGTAAQSTDQHHFEAL
ncbi:AGAP005413-PB [Anopheles gambiae str. PEST]|nr:AGAP005413-PB [Anopheles gambiae str. PEST]